MADKLDYTDKDWMKAVQKAGDTIDTDMKSVIDESFDGEEGILEIFKGVYSHAKKGSVPHAQFIMTWYFKDGEGGEEMKEFKLTRRIIGGTSKS